MRNGLPSRSQASHGPLRHVHCFSRTPVFGKLPRHPVLSHGVWTVNTFCPRRVAWTCNLLLTVRAEFLPQAAFGPPARVPIMHHGCKMAASCLRCTAPAYPLSTQPHPPGGSFSLREREDVPPRDAPPSGMPLPVGCVSTANSLPSACRLPPLLPPLIRYLPAAASLCPHPRTLDPRPRVRGSAGPAALTARASSFLG